MQPKIDRKELEEIVEETSRVDERFDEGEVKAVLRELGLPDNRLEEARRTIALRRKERQARRRTLMAIVAAGVLSTLVIGVVVHRAHRRDQALAQMQPEGASVEVLPGREVSLNVVLADPPQGTTIDLSCDWRAPDGASRYESRWQTKTIDKQRWPTHCRHAFKETDAPGTWSVTMKQSGRALVTKSFERP